MSKQGSHRLSVTLRTLAGTLGAYVATGLATAALSLVLARAGMDRVEAVIAATLGSFAIFAILAMAAFHARNARRAWLWMAIVSAPLGVVVLMLTPGAKG